MAAPVLVDYDSSWPARFRTLETLLRKVIGEDVLRIDHIGSTSVPGLAAKDVIDIQITVMSLDLADGWQDQIGPFRRRRDIGDDHVPAGGSPGPAWQKLYWSSADPASHLHVRELGRPNQRYALLFRDFLRAEPQAASAYEQAKLRLATACADKDVYSDAKDPICDLVMYGAEAWAAQTGWRPRPGRSRPRQ